MGRKSVKSDWTNITQSSMKLLTYDLMRCGMTQRTLEKIVELEEAELPVLWSVGKGNGQGNGGEMEGEGGWRAEEELRGWWGKRRSGRSITERTRIREYYYCLASPTVFHHWQLGGRMKVNPVWIHCLAPVKVLWGTTWYCLGLSKYKTCFSTGPWLPCVLESDLHSFTTGEKWTRLHILYRVIHDLWTLLQEIISRFLWSKI